MSIPDLKLVAADIMNKTQVHCSRRHSSNSLTEQCSLNIHGYGEGTTRMETGLCSAKYQINPYKACSSENALTRTTEKSVMPSMPLPSNPWHGFTYRFTHIHKYQQYWTEEIAEHNATNQKESRKRPGQ